MIFISQVLCLAWNSRDKSVLGKLLEIKAASKSCKISIDRQSLNIVRLLIGLSILCTNEFSISKTLLNKDDTPRPPVQTERKCVSLLETFDLQGATNACKLRKSTGFRDFLTKCWLVLHACCVPPLPWEIDHASLGDKALSIHKCLRCTYVYGNFSLRFCYLCSVYHTSRWSQQPIKWKM